MSEVRNVDLGCPKGAQVLIRTLTRTTISSMGRRCIYYTADERATARRQSDLKYSHSTHGKEVRAAAKGRQQRRKVARVAPPTSISHIPGLPPLSSAVQALQEIPLPQENPLYQAALSGAAWLDLSDMGRWNKSPPFEEDGDNTDPYSDDYLRFNKNLAAVLHGVRMRAQTERDIQRRTDFHGRGRKHAMDQLRKEVVELLKELERHYIQWHGRMIYHLYHLKFLDTTSPFEKQ
ncbi:hypothetical protein C8R45DRAFT_921495 [Mycena sanguinolenta]|nr:hypothetical protein C8R45DRAFT_921495 [Mycena sanguinolenta]